MWNSGITLRQRSDGSSRSVRRIFSAEITKFRWVSGTIFGLEVVPEV